MRRPVVDPMKAKTRQMYGTATRRAPASFDLTGLRLFFGQAMKRPLCLYCGATLTAKNVSLDHKTPLARGGQNALDNISFPCQPCNKSKGDMTHDEYRRLLDYLTAWEREAHNFTLRGKVLTALRVAQSFRQGANRRAKR